jgi:hypothetical protein
MLFCSQDTEEMVMQDLLFLFMRLSKFPSTLPEAWNELFPSATISFEMEEPGVGVSFLELDHP